MHKESAFTLVELLITIAITGILLGVVVPSFSDLIKQWRVVGEMQQVVSILTLARTESIKRSKVVTLCKSADGIDCGGDWRDGWLLFEDDNKDGAHDAGEERLAQGHLASEVNLSYRAFGSSNHLRFAPLGITLAHNGTFKLCPEDNDAAFARAVVINKLARVRATRDSNGDGHYETAGGDPLSCP